MDPSLVLPLNVRDHSGMWGQGSVTASFNATRGPTAVRDGAL
jgi:hypothetical protein